MLHGILQNGALVVLLQRQEVLSPSLRGRSGERHRHLQLLFGVHGRPVARHGAGGDDGWGNVWGLLQAVAQQVS